jgi:hypothetical protein
VGFFVSSCQNLKACLKGFTLYRIMNDCLCLHAERLPAVCPAGRALICKAAVLTIFSTSATFQKSAAAGAETI